MHYPKSTYQSKVFRNFKEIEREDYHNVIRYYEANEEEIGRLDFEEYFELLLAYIYALFRLEKYQQHLLMVDLAIENSIIQNIQFFNGEDIYRKLLYQKAVASYHTFDLDRSDHTLRELIKIDPEDGASVEFLNKCLRRKNSFFTINTRAISVFLFLLTAAIICGEALVIGPWYPHYKFEVFVIRSITFGAAWIALIGGHLFHRWQIRREVSAFVDFVRSKKQNS